MTPATGFDLIPATDADRPVIEALLQLYLYDMASDRPFPIGRDGRYAYDLLEPFWERPYLFLSGGELAGFALVISRCPITGARPCWFMAEFFVMRSFRRKSLGRQMLGQILARHPGLWHVAVQTGNEGAAGFWDSVTAGWRPEVAAVRFDEADWLLRAFQAGAGPA